MLYTYPASSLCHKLRLIFAHPLERVTRRLGDGPHEEPAEARFGGSPLPAARALRGAIERDVVLAMSHWYCTKHSPVVRSHAGGGAGVGAFVLGVIAEHTGLRPPIAVAAVIGMVIWYTVWRQRNVIVQSLQTTTTPSKKSQQPKFV